MMQISLGLSHTLGTERVLSEDINLYNPLAHDIEEEVGVMSTLFGSDHVIHHDRAQKPDIFLRELEERKWCDRARGVSKRNEGSFPLQKFEVVVEPKCRCQYIDGSELGKRTCVSFPTPSNTASTPMPFVISNTLCTVSSFVYRIT